MKKAALLLLVLAVATPAEAKTKPPLRHACQLVTPHEVSVIMGTRMTATVDEPTGCRRGGVPRPEVGLELYGFATVAAAKQYLAGVVSGYEFCVNPPDQFLPGSGLGNEAWVDGCNSNLVFRVARVVGQFTAFTPHGVTEGSSADTHRTAALARKAVRRLRKLRCPPSFCRGT